MILSTPDPADEAADGPPRRVLPLLADPGGYRPHTIDMTRSPEARREWLGIFADNLPGLERRAVESEGGGDGAAERAAAFRREFAAALDAIRNDEAAWADLSILKLCGMRRELLLRHGFEDPYLRVKQAENEAALELLPALLNELDALAVDDLAEMLVRGVFAGNIFDLGCAQTTALYESGKIDFRETRRRLPDRPWLIDDFDALRPRLTRRPPKRSLLMVDNAGADIVLGMIPLARHLLRLGGQVVLAANSQPALNDIIHPELVALVAQVAEYDRVIDEARAAGRLTVVPTGNDLPVIDLSDVDPALIRACTGVDLLVVEGMGRALETNLDARFTCDTLKIAMVKEADVAAFLGGRVYDVVCRYEPAG